MDTETELMSVEYSYDVFISYSQEDREWVRDELLPRLEEVGISYIDQFQFELGRPKLDEIERAITEGRKTLLVLSPAYLESDWQQFDSILVSSYGLDTGEWRAIPIVVQPCKLPTRLRALVSIDLSGDDVDSDSWQRLIEAVAPRSQAIAGPASRLSQKLLEDSRYNNIVEEMDKLLGGSDPSSNKGGTGMSTPEQQKKRRDAISTAVATDKPRLEDEAKGKSTLPYRGNAMPIDERKLIMLESRVDALKEGLTEIETKHRLAQIDMTEYLQLKTGYLTQYKMALSELESLLHEAGIAEMDGVFKKVKERRPEEEVRAELKEVAETAKQKGWGEHLLEQINAHKGEIVSLVVSAAVQIARTASGLL